MSYMSNPDRVFRLLMVNSSRGFIGGVERLMVSIANVLISEGFYIYGLFENSVFEDPEFDGSFCEQIIHENQDLAVVIDRLKSLQIDVVMIHKCSHWEWIQQLTEHFPVVTIIHDHDYYCIRKHKYFPLKRINCHLPFNKFYCLICSGVLRSIKPKMRLISSGHHSRLLHYIRRSTISFVLSEYMASNLVMNGWDYSTVRILVPWQNTLQIPVARRSCEKSINILYVGQLIRGKGVDILLKALSMLDFSWNAEIVGRGNDEEYLRNLSKKLGICDSVNFIGWSSDLDKHYGNADIVVVPSRWQEPFGLVGIEAFAHSKAVVAFDIGGISQWMRNGDNGLIAKAGDFRDLAKKITSLALNEDLRSKVSERAYQDIETKYNKDRHIESLLKPLMDIINANEKNA